VTLSDLVLVSAGIAANAATFCLGLLVGASLKRKDSHDNSNSNEATEGSRQWHLPPHGNAPRCNGNGPCSRRQPQPEADPVERFVQQRRPDSHRP
jgi:hypothetical protein